jgi:hypothetical protein
MTESYENDTAIDIYIQRNFRWNFLVNSLDGAAFGFGTAFFSSEIILPLFERHEQSIPRYSKGRPTGTHHALAADVHRTGKGG